MRSVKTLVAAFLVGSLVVIPLKFPSASSDFLLRWDNYGKLILPEGYRRMSDEEFMAWFCENFPDRCILNKFGIPQPNEEFSGDGGGGK